MKRIISIVMMFVVPFCLSACGSNNSQNGSASDSVTKQIKTPDISEKAESSHSETNHDSAGNVSKTLVVYFSCTGNTKSVSEKIAQLTEADLYEIVPERPYTDDDLDYNNDDCRANKEMNDDSARPEIGSEEIDLSGYDTVYIGYPIWWGTMPKIINTFLDFYDLSGKIIMPFCTSGSSGIDQSVSDIKNEEPDADVREGLRASGASDHNIAAWINDNKF